MEVKIVQPAKTVNTVSIALKEVAHAAYVRSDTNDYRIREKIDSSVLF